MTLAAQLVVRLGGFSLEAEVSVANGEIVAVLGPNGAGKSTLLRAIAGLSPLERGRVTLGERVLEDTEAAVRLVPEARGIGVVFQDYLLFPHLDARDNVAFGLRAGGMDATLAR